MTRNQKLFDLLKQAKAALNTLAASDLSKLSDDDFEAVVVTTNEFFDLLQSAFSYLAALRQPDNA